MMASKRSAINCLSCAQVFTAFVLIYAARILHGYTNPADVAAINGLYVALGSPSLPGWVPNGGDPCTESWQGVLCNNTDISSIILIDANLGGELGDSLSSFTSIKGIQLSNNHIGGSIPSNLPVTLQTLFLSDNELSGSIPSSLSSLTLLSAMSLNGNQLTGEIPDAFQGLIGLFNLDLSSNNLSGQLPPSLENLSSLTTLHLQNNQLSGTLDVLQDLTLKDLNIENNLFNGPIPDKLLSIPNFKKDGNPFNSSIAPLPSATSPTTPPPAPSFSGPPSSGKAPGTSSSGKAPGGKADGPSAPEESNAKRSKKTTKRVVWISIAGVLSFIILVLAILLFMPRYQRRRQEADRISKRHELAPYEGIRDNGPDSGSIVLASNQIDKVPKVAVVKPKEDHQTGSRTGLTSKPRNESELNMSRMSAIPRQDGREIDMSRYDIDSLMPPPPPPPPPSPPPLPPTHFEKVIVEPISPATATIERPSAKSSSPRISAKSYTIAFLQQHTNSFSQENLIGAGMLGSVYRAELPDGKLLAVKKLDKKASSQQKDDEFLHLVNTLDQIRHANVVELMGYSAEHGQRLLIYEYCSNGTLQDALHSDDEFKKQLSWNTRIRMALGAARALEYLHEVSEPPIIHRNFKSANVLLDDELHVHVSDCGLATLISSGSVSQLSGNLLTAYGYGAPEFESGIYTSKSDVYSFGVVMLELLTGRKSHDRTRNRGEQFLVRWAIPQLHDIDALSRMVDPSLHGECPVKSLSFFADIIARCVQAEPGFRPPMSEVVQDLLQMLRREPPTRQEGE